MSVQARTYYYTKEKRKGFSSFYNHLIKMRKKKKRSRMLIKNFEILFSNTNNKSILDFSNLSNKSDEIEVLRYRPKFEELKNSTFSEFFDDINVEKIDENVGGKVEIKEVYDFGSNDDGAHVGAYDTERQVDGIGIYRDEYDSSGIGKVVFISQSKIWLSRYK